VDRSNVQHVRGQSGFAEKSASPLLQALRVIHGAADPLLSVREVAERLKLSTATVYKIVESGELAHCRVSNAVRVTEADLAAFVALSRG
jgi:excisionase family DNA binding protein